MTYPELFLQRVRSTDTLWWIRDGDKQFETLILEEDNANNLNQASFIVGMKQENYTYVYMEITSVEYVYDSRSNSDYFNIVVTDDDYSKTAKLVNNLNLTHGLSQEAVVTKLEKYGRIYREELLY